MSQYQYTNIAFISYKREDEEWAKWLQNKLEHYKLPTEITKENPDLEFKDRPRHVFKDTTDLSGGVLAKAIKDGLESSKYLIVICSPRAAKSPWVCKEVQEFIDSGREEYIIPFIIDGEPNSKDPDKECFPSALKSLSGERELLGININENGRDSAAVKVVARMFDLRFDTLWDRFQKEAERRRRYTIGGFIVAILFLLGIIAAGAWSYNEIERQRDKAETEKAHALAETKRANKEKNNAEQANKKLLVANDSITKQKSRLQKAYNDLTLSQKNLAQSNADLQKINENLEIEKNNVLAANQTILKNRSIEYGNLAYDYIEQGKMPEAENLLNKIIPNGKNPYVYTPEMEKALRRYINYKDMPGIKLVENKEIIGESGGESVLPHLSKYGYRPPSRNWDSWYRNTKGEYCGTAVINSQNDTLLTLHEDFDGEYLDDSGHIYIGEIDDTISIWDVDNKKCLVKKYLNDGLIDMKFLNNDRVIIMGYEYFTVFHYSESGLQIESKTKILGERLHNYIYSVMDSPFCYDDESKRIVYQIGDSCLIVQNVNSSQILKSRKINGIIKHLALGKLNGSDFYIAYNYEQDNSKLHIDRNRLQILHYPTLTYLYEQNMDKNLVWRLGFLPDGHFYVHYGTLKAGVSNLYVWDMSVPFKYNGYLYNMDSTFVIDYKRAKNIYDEVLCITKDNKIIYTCGDKMDDNSDSYKLCVFDTKIGETDTLSTSSDIHSLKFQDSYNGQYVVFSHKDKEVYLYDKMHHLKLLIDSNAKYSDVSISSDGNVICYKNVGQIIIRNLKNGHTCEFHPNVDYVSYLNLNHNGTHILFLDNNYSVYDYNLSTNEYRQISSSLGYTNCFGFSENDKYIYQIYRGDRSNSKSHIRVWDFNTLDIIMDDELEYNADMVIFNEQNNFIYSHSDFNSNKISFLPLSNLFEIYNKYCLSTTR